MRLVIFDDLQLGVLRDGQVYDVSQVVGANADDWPPIFWVKTIAEFDRLRPMIEDAAARGKGRPLESVRLRAPVLFPSPGTKCLSRSQGSRGCPSMLMRRRCESGVNRNFPNRPEKRRVPCSSQLQS